MTQNRLPEFNDPNAKSRRKFHNTFNGYVIEVLYGARDAEGKPVAPKDGENDGHGRWYGIETEGNYTMFSWQKPADEGGETEYGTEYKDDALSVMKETYPKYIWILVANPLTAILETFKYAFTGVGEFNWLYLGYSTTFTLIILLLGFLVFNRVQRNFMDVI